MAGVKRLRPPETNNSTTTIAPGSTLHSYQQHSQQQNNYNHGRNHQHQSAHHQHQLQQQQQKKQFRPNKVYEPRYINYPQTHTPTWDHPLPPMPRRSAQNSNRGGSTSQMKHFELSLLNLSEFTITGLPVTMDGRPSSVLGFRKIIKEVSRGHGKAIFERDDAAKAALQNNNNNNSRYPSYMDNNENDENNSSVNWDGGKWRIPLVRFC